jgi:hypothetical protein
MADESVESMINQSPTSEAAPTADFTPMPEAPEPKRKKEFTAEIDGLRDAAREVSKAREERGDAPLQYAGDRVR